jgi:TonB-linked SusC/RagA family outer membrane protein
MKTKFTLSLLVILSLFGFSVSAQEITVSGNVTSSEDGMTMPGVSIVVLGSSNGTSTDFDGNFTINANVGDQLQFTFIGYAAQTVTVSGPTMNVVMKTDAEALDEVVVVAYGTAKKESFTGSATTVEVKDLKLVNSDNITKSLEGLSAGVQISTSSGQPGASSTIRIRGIGSVDASSSPLIVVDGFPYGGELNSIPSENIQSMTVLKDAAAKSLYGSRAANGVIIITTKKGKAGDSKVRFKSVVGVSSRAIPEYDVMGVPQYYETFWQRLYNENGGDGVDASSRLIEQLGSYNAYDVADDQVVDNNGKINPNGNLLWNDNWHDEAFQTGIRQEYDLEVSGGTDKAQYLIGGNYLDSDGIVKASNFKRYAIRANVNSQVNDWFKMSLGTNASSSYQNFPNSSGSAYANIFMFARNIAPIYPVFQYDLSGSPILDANGNKQYDYGNAAGRSRAYASNSNPLGTIALDTRWNKSDIFSGRGSLEFSFTKDLKLQVNSSLDYLMRSSLTHQNRNFGDAAEFNGRSTRTDTRFVTFNANQILTYNKSFGEHSIGLLAGHESYQIKTNYLSATRTGFAVPDFTEIGGAAIPEGSNSYEDNHRIESYFGQIEYDFMSKYFVKATVRTDGSSRFAPENRWGTFWSASASWRVSQEEFLQDLDWLDNLKLKGSYGTSGNEALGNFYAYSELWSFYANDESNGLFISRLGTPDLSWEKTKELNIGVDAKFFNRLSLTIEYYDKLTDDLLAAKPLAPSSGNSSIQQNLGSLRNSGIEIELGFDIFKSQDFNWNIGINGSANKNEWVELATEDEGITVGSFRYEVGKSIYDFYIQEWAGVDQTTGAPQWYMNEIDPNTGDETGKRVKTSNYGQADRYFVGSSLPDLRGGITSRMEFFGFDFTVLTSYSIGGNVYDSPYAGLMDASSTIGNNWHTDMANAWTSNNTNTDVPVLNPAISRDANSRSTRFLRSANYFAINNATFGYTFSKNFTSSIGLEGFRIYVAGDNLFVMSSFKGLDPRQSISGLPGNNYTPIRTISGGVNINF